MAVITPTRLDMSVKRHWRDARSPSSTESSFSDLFASAQHAFFFSFCCSALSLSNSFGAFPHSISIWVYQGVRSSACHCTPCLRQLGGGSARCGCQLCNGACFAARHHLTARTLAPITCNACSVLVFPVCLSSVLLHLGAP